MRRCGLGVVVLFGCGCVAEAAPTGSAKVDRKALPEWKVPAVEAPPPPPKRSGQTDVFALDADGDQLLMALAHGGTFVQVASGKRLTGRVSAPTQYEAFAAVAAQLAIDIKPIKLTGRGSKMFTFFPPSTVASLVDTIVFLHNVNIVVAPAPAPQLVGILDHQPWDGYLAAIVDRAGLSLVAAGTTQYVLAKGAKLPPLPKTPAATVDLDARGATLAQAVAALRGVTKLAVGSCSTTKLQLKLERVKLAEAVRALEVASGEKLTAKAKCPPKKISDDEAKRLKRLAMAKSGNKSAYVFDDNGTLAIAGSEDLYPSIGAMTPPKATDVWLARFKRTAAVLRSAKQWSALVETSEGWRLVEDGSSSSEDPEGVRFHVREDGVHVMRDETTEWKHLPLAK